jgi:hypothetical protein
MVTLVTVVTVPPAEPLPAGPAEPLRRPPGTERRFRNQLRSHRNGRLAQQLANPSGSTPQFSRASDHVAESGSSA